MAELAEYTRRELDFRREARTAERVGELLVGEEGVVVPAVDWDRASQRVVTMELLEGERPAPAEQLRERASTPTRCFGREPGAMLRQIFVSSGRSSPASTRR